VQSNASSKYEGLGNALAVFEPETVLAYMTGQEMLIAEFGSKTSRELGRQRIANAAGRGSA